MLFLDEMYENVFIDEKLKNQVFVDHEIRDDKDDYFESTDLFKKLFGSNEEIEYFYLRMMAQSKSAEYLALIAKTPEERFYILYTALRNNVTNKNVKEGISGVTTQYHKYYHIYQPEDTDEIFVPEPAVAQKSKISKEKMEEIGVYNKSINDTSYDTSNHIIQRSDFPYEKIYFFEKYEFSNNIAYELAKRSEYPLANFEDIHILKHILLDIISIEYSLTLHLNADQMNVIKKYLSSDDFFCAVYDFLANGDVSIEEIYRNHFHFPSIHRYRNYTNYDDYLKEHLQYYNFINEEDYFSSKSKHTQSIHLPRYKSPPLNQTVFLSNDYNINIALPKDELIDYILKLKEDFNKSINHNHINILELMFGNKDQYYDEIANMLFIYDSIRVGFKYEHIEHSLSAFDAENIEKAINKKIPNDRKTIRKYFFYAKLLIEDGYYLALITSAHIFDIDVLKGYIQQIKKSNS